MQNTNAVVDTATTSNEKDKILKDLTDVTDLTKKLLNISRKVYKGETVLVGDNHVVTASDIQSYRSLLISKLNEIRSDIRSLRVMKKRNVNSQRKTTGGLNGPTLFDMKLVEFFREARLGPAYHLDPSTNKYVEVDTDLRNQLKLFLSTGMIRSSSLTTLFTIYINTHPDIVNPNERQYIRADELMEKHFGDVFKTFENFDKNRFLRTMTTAIAYRFVIKKDKLTDEQKKLLESNQDTINREADVIKETNAYYKQKRLDEEKRIKAENKAKKRLDEASARSIPINLTSPKKQQVNIPRPPQPVFGPSTISPMCQIPIPLTIPLSKMPPIPIKTTYK
jgi:hypothetical protein